MLASPKGLPVVLLETWQLCATTKYMPVKTDRNNARAMAQVVRTGWFKAAHVKSERSQQLHALLRRRGGSPSGDRTYARPAPQS